MTTTELPCDHGPATAGRPLLRAAGSAARAGRPPLTRAERGALALVATATAGFAVYGTATGASSTVAYVVVVSAVTGLVAGLRRHPLPAALVLPLAGLAVAHLAGGLVAVGDGVLYNASWRTEVLQYDHVVHGSAVFVGTLLVWTMFAPLVAAPARRPALVAVWVLAGLGLGAVNEMIEFLATLAHDGSHVGGYENTGWDLVANVAGAAAAGGAIAAASRRRV